MKEAFVFLWTSAPEVMSLLIIGGILVFIASKVTLFFTEFKQMKLGVQQMKVEFQEVKVRVTNLEVRMERLEQKVDQIIDYLIQFKNQGK